MSPKKFILFTSLIALVFLLALGFNISPYLRGPGIYPPDWRWPYQLSFSFQKFIFPISIMLLIFLVSLSKKIQSKEKLFLFLLVILGFLLQISLLFYSRAGLGVMLHRITNPMINGYFTVSLGISSIDLIKTFNQSLGSFPMYAKFHPPLAILFFSALNCISNLLGPLFFLVEKMSVTHLDVLKTWQILSSGQKLTALYSGFFIALLSYLTLVPIYFSAKLLYSKSVAIKAVILFMFIPSVLLFTPLNDVFLPLFSASSLYLLLVAFKTKNSLLFFFSGLVLSIAIYFSLTFLPVILLFVLIFLLRFKKEFILKLKLFICFLVGLFVMPALFFFLGLNSLEMFFKMMQFHETAQHERQYFTWLFYNFYDFFIFLGIPLATIFLAEAYLCIRNKFRKTDFLFLAFLITILIVDLTGSVRAETARIWLPYIPFLIIPAANFIEKKGFTKRHFCIIIFLQALTVFILQSVLIALY
jgi:hypothetical protein